MRCEHTSRVSVSSRSVSAVGSFCKVASASWYDVMAVLKAARSLSTASAKNLLRDGRHHRSHALPGGSRRRIGRPYCRQLGFNPFADRRQLKVHQRIENHTMVFTQKRMPQ